MSRKRNRESSPSISTRAVGSSTGGPKAVCVICLEDVVDQSATLDACSHRFHVDCILTWSKVENTCPQCKARFEEIETTDVDSTSEEKKIDSAAGDSDESKAKRRKIPVERRDQRIDYEFTFDASPEIVHLLNTFLRFAQDGPPRGRGAPRGPGGRGGGGAGGGPRLAGIGGGGGGGLFGLRPLSFGGDFASFMESLGPSGGDGDEEMPPLEMPSLVEEPANPHPFFFEARRLASAAAALPVQQPGARSAFASSQQGPNSRVPNSGPSASRNTPTNTQATTNSSRTTSQANPASPFPPPPPPPPGLPRLPNQTSVSIAPLGLNGLSSAQSLSSSPSRFDASQSNSVGVFSSQQAPTSRGQGVASSRLHNGGQRSRSARSGSEPLLPSSRQHSRSGSSSNVRDLPSSGNVPSNGATRRSDAGHGDGEDPYSYAATMGDTLEMPHDHLNRSAQQNPFSMLFRDIFTSPASTVFDSGASAEAANPNQQEHRGNSDSQSSASTTSGSGTNASPSADARTIPGSFRSFFIPFGAAQSAPMGSDTSNSGGTANASQQQQQQQQHQQRNAPGQSPPPGISVRRFTFHSHLPGSRGSRNPSSHSQAPQNSSSQTQTSRNPFEASVFSALQQSSADDAKMSDDSVGGAGATSSANGSGTAAVAGGSHLLRTSTASSASTSSTSYSYVAPPRRSSRLNLARGSGRGSAALRGGAPSTRASRGTGGSSRSGDTGARPDFLRQRERASMSQGGRRARGGTTSTNAGGSAAGVGAGAAHFGEQLLRDLTSQMLAQRVPTFHQHTAAGIRSGSDDGSATGARRPPPPIPTSSSSSSSSSSATSGADARSGSTSSRAPGARRSSFLGQLAGSSFLSSLRSFFVNRFGGGSERPNASSSSSSSAAPSSSSSAGGGNASSSSSSPGGGNVSGQSSSSSSSSPSGPSNTRSSTAAQPRRPGTHDTSSRPSQPPRQQASASQDASRQNPATAAPLLFRPRSGPRSRAGSRPNASSASIPPPLVPLDLESFASPESFASFISGNGLGLGVPHLRRVPIRAPDGTVGVMMYSVGLRVPVSRNQGNQGTTDSSNEQL